MKVLKYIEGNLAPPDSLLQVVMDMAFDVSFITDVSGFIVSCSDSMPLIFGRPKDEIIGHKVSELDQGSDFAKFISGDKIMLSKILIINGLVCYTHIIPLYKEGEIRVGTFCAIPHRGMDKLRSLVEDVNLEEKPENIKYSITRPKNDYSFNDFIGVSPEIIDVLKTAKKASRFDYSVLIRGETGTGKELMASGIHTESNKDEKAPFVKINCTAIPRELLESELFGHEKGAFTGAFARKQGKFEVADNGTVLLDEIGDMELSLQSKLLRVLEDREFERVGGNEIIPFRGRIIASTNRNLERMIRMGQFREDLYYRLCTIEISIPPVRNSKEDIIALFNYFMEKNNLHTPFSPGAISLLKNYDWPGNVRQIKNVVAKLSMIEDINIFRADHIREILMPVHYIDKIAGERDDRKEDSDSNKGSFQGSSIISNTTPQPPPLEKVPTPFNIQESGLSHIEKAHILDVLNKNSMNIAASARVLGISRNTLYNKIKKYNINLKRVFY